MPASQVKHVRIHVRSTANKPPGDGRGQRHLQDSGYSLRYFGLYGEGSFETFPEEFLYPDIEAYIWGTFLLPWNWDWLVNPLVGTNDLMTQVSDRLMFHGATFADLARR